MDLKSIVKSNFVVTLTATLLAYAIIKGVESFLATKAAQAQTQQKQLPSKKVPVQQATNVVQPTQEQPYMEVTN